MSKRDTMVQVARYWNNIAEEFDSIYTGKNKSAVARALDRYFRADIYGRFDWVMRHCGDIRGRSICDIGCGSGRFVAEFVRRGAGHVTGVDVAPEMIRLAEDLVAKDGVADRCDFDLSTFPAIRAWLKRVEATPGFVAMDWFPVEIDNPASIAAGV